MVETSIGRRKQKITVGTVHGVCHLDALVLTLFLFLFLFEMGQSLNSANSLLLLFCSVYIILNAFNNSSAFHELALSVSSLTSHLVLSSMAFNS